MKKVRSRWPRTFSFVNEQILLASLPLLCYNNPENLISEVYQ